MSSAEVTIRSESTPRGSARRCCAGIAGLCQAVATWQWRAVLTPFGRAEKHPSAAPRSLELARPVRRSRVLQLGAFRRAECIGTSAEDI